MKCPHCTKEIYFDYEHNQVFECEENEKRKYQSTGYEIEYGSCPACSELIVIINYGKYSNGEIVGDIRTEIAFPKYISRNISLEVPEYYKIEYKEAVGVLSISPKSSAALSRRILQRILHEEYSINKSSLAKEIDEFLLLQKIPSYLSEAIDAIRNIGNFAAHPLKDTNTGMIVEVESGEAEWLLDVLDALFDFTFIQPKILKTRKNELNKKLNALGKPTMK